MIFKLNLAACVAYLLADFGLMVYAGNWMPAAPSDFAILLFLFSPGLLWAFVAWLARPNELWSRVCLVISTLLLGLVLWGTFLDVEMTREEAITKQYTMHFAAYLAILFQWVMGLPVLLTFIVVRLVLRWKAVKAPSDRSLLD